MRASAVATRRPALSTRPSVRITPLVSLMPRTNEILNSSVGVASARRQRALHREPHRGIQEDRGIAAMHRADRIVMAQTRHAVNHDGAGFDRAVERLDRLHDRRLRQPSREDRADKIEPRHRCYHVDGYDTVFNSVLAG